METHHKYTTKTVIKFVRNQKGEEYKDHSGSGKKKKKKSEVK
jgi:hypothetical protein